MQISAAGSERAGPWGWPPRPRPRTGARGGRDIPIDLANLRGRGGGGDSAQAWPGWRWYMRGSGRRQFCCHVGGLIVEPDLTSEASRSEGEEAGKLAWRPSSLPSPCPSRALLPPNEARPTRPAHAAAAAPPCAIRMIRHPPACTPATCLVHRFLVPGRPPLCKAVEAEHTTVI